jgi:hypothetical protein
MEPLISYSIDLHAEDFSVQILETYGAMQRVRGEKGGYHGLLVLTQHATLVMS